MNTDDITLLLQHVDITVQPKSMPEHPDDAKLRRFKDKYLFLVTLILIMCAFLGDALYIAFRPNSPYLSQMITAGFGLVMALAGYFVRGGK
jgi:hypothetical protein